MEGHKLISLKDYAKQKNITYEAVRKQVNRFRNELNGHIHFVGRTQYLDDDAICFLDERRKQNPVVVLQTDKDDEIQQLYNENKALLLKVAELQESLIRENEEVKALQQKQIGLLQAQQEQTRQLRQQIAAALAEAEAAKAELGRKLSWRERLTGRIGRKE